MERKDKIKSILSAPVSWINELRYPSPNILTDTETVKLIKEQNLSLSRFGDGEFCLMRGIGIKFQEANRHLAKRLTVIANEEIEGHLVALPYMVSHIKESKEFLSDKSYKFWKRTLLYSKGFYNKYFHRSVYGDTNLSRFYIERKDKDERTEYVNLLKSLFVDQRLFFVEGRNTHLGVDNDLFGNIGVPEAKCRRLICPSKNAFDKYEQILDKVMSCAHKDEMIILSLGPTATVLSRDLAVAGFRVLDLGHIDIEYMWWQQKADTPQIVKGKDMTEVSEFKPKENEDQIYLSQIVGVVE